MTITERVKYLSNLAFEFDFDNYLTSGNKQFIVFEIQTTNKIYSLKEGHNINQIIEQANHKYIDSKAGYLVDIRTKFDTQEDADLLLLSDIVLYSNPIDLDTIIIHELVHQMIDSGNDGEIHLTDEAKIIGSQVYKITDYPNEYRTRHSEDFCQKLAQACIVYCEKTRNFSTGLLTIRSAMRFDIFEE